MAFLPSTKLKAALANANVGLWIEQLGGGRIALVCKIPEIVIKALYRHATTSLLLAVIRAETLNILCLGLRINDEPDNPFSATMPNVSSDDSDLLMQVLESKSIALHCFNELGHPVLSAWCTLGPEAATIATASFSSLDRWFLTPSSSKLLQLSDLSRILGLALDRFQRHIYGSQDDPGCDQVKMMVDIPLTLEIWKPTEIFEGSPTILAGPFLIDDEEEGLKLERLIHLIVDNAYPGSCYRSPSVQNGSVTRELTDVLGFDSDSICIIQAKAMAVLTVKSQRSSSRRAASVTKDIRKALGQLGGALSKIRSASSVFDVQGKPIAVPDGERTVAHAIVVLSEMYTLVDWKAVASAVVKLSDSQFHRAFFHVFDIQELATLVHNCADSGTFHSRLMQRWVAVKEKGTAYVRTALLK